MMLPIMLIMLMFLEGGKLVRSGYPKEVFQDVAFLESKQLGGS